MNNATVIRVASGYRANGPRLWTSVFLGALMMVTLAACGPNYSDSEHVERARQFQAQGDIKATEVELKTALQKNPSNLDARWLLGQLYVSQQQWEAALKELTRAEQLGLAYREIAIPLGRALLGQGEHEQLLERVDVTAIDDANAQSVLHALRGRAYSALDDLPAARGAFAAALRLDEDNVNAKVGKAWTFALADELDTAKAELERILAQHPDAGEAWRLKGDIEAATNQSSAAVESYSKALEYGENSRDLLYVRSLELISLGRLEQATEDLNQLKRWGKTPQLQYVAGLIAFQKKDDDAAYQHLIAVQDYADQLPGLNARLGVLHFVRGEYEQAVARLQGGYKNRRMPESLERILALACLQIQDYVCAERSLRGVLLSDPDDPVTLTLLSEVAFPQGKSAEGVSYLRKVVAQAQDSAPALVKLGQGLLRAGEDKEAVEVLEQARGIDPTDPSATQRLIMAHINAGRLDQALDVAKAYTNDSPQDPVAHNLLGLVWLARNESDAARQRFIAAMGLEPGFPPAGTNLAMLAMKAEDLDQAMAYVEEVLEHHPVHVDTHLLQAEIAGRQQNLALAETALRQAVGLAPTALKPKLALARLQLLRQHPTDAVATLSDVKETDIHNPERLAVLGNAHLQAGQAEQAIKVFEQLVYVQADSASAHQLLAQARAATGDADGTREALNAALAADPTHFASRLALARLDLQQGNIDAADDGVRRLLNRYPESPLVWGLQGQLAMRRGNPAAAVEAFRLASEKQASDRGWMLGLASAQRAAGNANAAVSTVQDWLTTHAGDPVALQALGNLEMERGNERAAINAYQALVEHDDSDVVALNNLAIGNRCAKSGGRHGKTRHSGGYRPGSANMRGDAIGTPGGSRSGDVPTGA